MPQSAWPAPQDHMDRLAGDGTIIGFRLFEIGGRLDSPADRGLQALREFQSERLMWATDFPWILEHPGYDKMRRLIDELLPNLAEEERTAIMGGTAKQVLRIPDPAGSA